MKKGQNGHRAKKSLAHLNKHDVEESFDVQKQVAGMSLDMGGASKIGKQGLFGKGKTTSKRFGY